jgi:hypothetical protein
VQSLSEGKWGRKRGGSTVLKADDKTKSGAVVREAKGGSWHLEVKDDQRKLGRWADCAFGPNCLLGQKKYDGEYEMG